MTPWLLLFLIFYCVSVFIEQVAAFGAGGFGKGKTANKPNNGKSSNKRKRRGLIRQDLESKSTAQVPSSTDPKLDRFGLPIATSENIFPPLPDDTILEHVSEHEIASLATVQSSMNEYTPLNFGLFDENSVEKDPSGNKQPWKLKLLHKNPPVVQIENFFTDSECDEYINFTKVSNNEEMSPLKINSATFSSLAQSKRTSTTWYCHYKQVPMLLAKAKRLLDDLPLTQMEEPQIVQYKKGEQFSWHYDEIPESQLNNGGQRIATLLVYLNSLSNEGGGGTIFRDLKGFNGTDELKMRPKKGSALLFFPAKLDGTPDDRTLHKGEVAVDEKMICQMWIHEGHYSPVVPEGNSHDAALEAIKEAETLL
jgi:prolyl 4-hydroxylase